MYMEELPLVIQTLEWLGENYEEGQAACRCIVGPSSQLWFPIPLPIVGVGVGAGSDISGVNVNPPHPGIASYNGGTAISSCSAGC